MIRILIRLVTWMMILAVIFYVILFAALVVAGVYLHHRLNHNQYKEIPQ